MNNDEKMFELMTKMYSEMQIGFENVYSEMQIGFEQVNDRLDKVESRLDGVENRLGKVESRLDGVENRLGKVESRLDGVEKAVVRIENNHGQKLTALFDGYKQNSDKLDRIEAEVTKHEEIILRKIR